jgi:hypothetical protein
MHYDHETLVNMSLASYYDIDLAKLGPRVKNTVIRALTHGAMPFDSGSAATTYSILSDAFDLPAMFFSTRGTYSNSLAVKRLPAEATKPLAEWWNVDRVTFRMERPEDWNSYVTQSNRHTYYKNRIVMPYWISEGCGMKGLEYIPILCSKTKGDKATQTHFLTIAKAYSDMQEYKDKVAPIIEKVKSSSIVQIKSFNKQLTGV